jgi:hypothetical protein
MDAELFFAILGIAFFVGVATGMALFFVVSCML